METRIDENNIEGDSKNAIIFQSILNQGNLGTIDDIENLLISNKKLTDARTTRLLNEVGTDPESMNTLKIEQQELEATRNSMLNEKNQLMDRKTALLKQEITINGKNINLETWVANHRFEMWNYSNKISRIEVHYTGFGIMGMRILYREPSKAPENVGVVVNTNASSPTTITNVDFADDEWLMQIQISNSNSNSNTFTLCDSISFYTNKNLQGTSPKVTIPTSSQNNVIKNKIYYISPARRTWLQHKSNAEAQGATLACFENSNEIAKMLTELGNARFQNGGSFYIGLYHTNALIQNNNSGGGIRNNVESNKNSTWKWVDGTPYNPNTTNWNGGEPNNWGPGENVGQMYSNGKINDLTKTNQLAAIYQKKIMNTNTQTIRKNGEHIKSFTIKPLAVTYDFITSLDVLQKVNAESAVENTRQVINQIRDTARTLDASIKDIDEAIAKININIEHIKSKIIVLNKLNEDGEQYLNSVEPFTNAGGNLFSGHILETMIEGNQNNLSLGGGLGWEDTDDEDDGAGNQVSPSSGGGGAGGGSGNQVSPSSGGGGTGGGGGGTGGGGGGTGGGGGGNQTVAAVGGYYAALQNASNQTNQTIGALLNNIYRVEDNDIASAITEYTIKKDDIFSNVLTDYMLTEKKQNSIEDVYSKIDQQNKDKTRKIETNTFYDKAYKEYIDILKVIIFVCIILVPIVIANKNSILPNNITNYCIVAIIFLTVIYIISKFIDIYMRDNKDFDKIRIPYDREAAKLEKSGTITRKNNLLSSFGRTCIGEDCCPDPASGMIFDYTKNRCIAKETYSDYSNGSVDGYLGENFNGYFDGLLGKSNQQNSFSLVQPFVTKEQLSGASLNNSSTTHFNK
jgi:hypothetical protein